MFYNIRMDELISETPLLSLVNKHINLRFIRSKVKHLYMLQRDKETRKKILWINFLYK
jgi:hypothetical protein